MRSLSHFDARNHEFPVSKWNTGKEARPKPAFTLSLSTELCDLPFPLESSMVAGKRGSEGFSPPKAGKHYIQVGSRMSTASESGSVGTGPVRRRGVRSEPVWGTHDHIPADRGLQTTHTMSVVWKNTENLTHTHPKSVILPGNRQQKSLISSKEAQSQSLSQNSNR